MAKTNLTAERLRELFNYDPETGVFKRRIATGRHGCNMAGTVAGCLKSHGYIALRIEGTECYAHRLAWLYIHDKWPSHEIDHINGNKSDNRLTNLRDIIPRNNKENIRAATVGNKSGFLGVSPYRGRWQASICIGGKQHWLGIFSSPESAYAVYLAVKREFHNGCTI